MHADLELTPQGVVGHVLFLLDKIATIKAALVSVLLTGGIGIVNNIDWLAVLGVIVAVLTALAQLVRVITDLREDRRRQRRFEQDDGSRRGD